MVKNSITNRWLRSTMLIILVFFIFILVFGVRSIQIYYYNGVKQVLLAQSNALMVLIEQQADSSPEKIEKGIYEEIEKFSHRDTMDITAINRHGVAIRNSTGFDDLGYVLEFDKLEDSQNLWWEGKTEFGEDYMSYTFVVPSHSKIHALRFATSLDRVNNQIIVIIVFFAILAFFIMLAVIYSGAYFINSIVIPVGQVSAIARKIAMGDFSQKLVVKNEDEIGELCESINFMAQELAESEQIKNDFVSSVSHELKTPLTAIKGWTETLMDIDDKEVSEKGLNIILKETNRLQGMLAELLDFSKIQSGRFSLMVEEVDLASILEETVEMFRERAIRENVELEYYFEENLPFVMGDKNRLKQVFVNVLDNALKYTPEKGSIICNTKEEDGYIIATIQDTGSGISKEDLEHVKTKFYKGAKARQGSGIGLSVVDEIVVLHKGKLEISSEKFEGTKITITIPSINIKTEDMGKKEQDDEQK